MGHAVHAAEEVAFVTPEYVPAGQLVHELCAMVGPAYVPGTQSMQLDGELAPDNA